MKFIQKKFPIVDESVGKMKLSFDYNTIFTNAFKFGSIMKLFLSKTSE